MNKLILPAILLCLFNSLASHAQNWVRVADWNLTRRMCPISFSWNGRGYVGLGHDYNAAACFKDIGYYDPVTNQWGDEAYLDPPGRTGAFCFCYKNLLFFGGGTLDSGANALRDFYCYNLEGKSLGTGSDIPFYKKCDTLADLPFNKAFGSKAVVVNDTAYLVGGCASDSCEKFLWSYDIVNRKWVKGVALPFSSQFGYAFALQGKIYYGGGNDNTGYTTREFWVFDPRINKWTSVGNLPGASRTMGVGIAINDSEAIVGSGYNYNGYREGQIAITYSPNYRMLKDKATEHNYLLSDFWKYNVQANLWKKIKRFPDARRNACAFIADGYLYISMGNSMKGITISTYKIKIAGTEKS